MKKSLIVLIAVLLVGFSAIIYYGYHKKTEVSMPKAENFEGLTGELQQLYRIDQLPVYRSGSAAGQFSSWDTTGGNDDGFNSTYSYIRKEGPDSSHWVIAEMQGPGVINRIWTPTPTEDTVEFYFDGESEPRIAVRFIDLFNGEAYPFITPIVGNEIGGYYCYMPIPYQKSVKVVYKVNQEKLRFYQLQYRTLPEGKSIESFSMELSEEEKAELEKAAGIWAGYGNKMLTQAVPDGFEVEVESETVKLMPGQSYTFFESGKGGRIVGIEIEPAHLFEGPYKQIILQAQWDDDPVMAINAPVSDFFGYSFGQTSTRSLLLGSNNGVNYCYFPMPFDESAILSLLYDDMGQSALPELQLDVRTYYVPAKRDPEREGKFYSYWRRETDVPEGEDYLLLQAQGKGHQVGAIQQAQGLKPGITLYFEGDDITTIDGQMRLHGTGSEDFYNGGWYAVPDRWDQAFSLPLHGCLTYSIPLARTGGYRIFMGDKLSFEESFHQTIEHGGEGNTYPVDYTSIAFYYGDTPPQDQMEPTGELQAINDNKEMEWIMQLVAVKAMGVGASVSFEQWEDDNEKRIWVYRLSQDEPSMMKIDLDIAIEGEYDVYFDYFKTPKTGKFKVYHRQEPISDWADGYAEESEYVRKHKVGRMHARPGMNTLTIKTQAEGENEFVLGKVFLIKTGEEKE